MRKHVYLGTAFLMLGGLCWTACSEDEKIVEVEKEVEKIVVEKDYTKLSDAEREGLKGSPKTITEFYSMTAVDGGVKPTKWESRTVVSYNNAGYKTGKEVYQACFDSITVETDPLYLGDFMLHKNKKLQLVERQSFTLGEDNKPVKIEGMKYDLSYFLIAQSGDSAMISNPTEGQWHNCYDNFGDSILLKDVRYQMGETESITTIDKTAKKATRIVRTKSIFGNGNFEDSKKSVLNLDEFGWPNENSREDFGVAYEYKLTTRAFGETADAKYIEVLDDKGNWIERYTTDFSAPYYRKRDIVYY